jgi:hypothetical protein
MADSFPLLEASTPESRHARRFTTQTPLPAQFLAFPVTVWNLGGGGVQIEHSEPIKLGVCGTLRIDSVYAGETMTFAARIAWSHLSKNVDVTGKFRYRSGLLLIEPSSAAVGALGRLIHSFGRPDVGSLDRKRQVAAEKLKRLEAGLRGSEITPEQLEKVRAARAYLQVNLDEAQKWYNRAKFSFANVAGGDATLPYRHDVLAIWEYVGRTISLPTIAQALETMK